MKLFANQTLNAMIKEQDNNAHNHVTPCEPLPPHEVLSPETLRQLNVLGLSLKKVYLRMRSEGYDIINGTITRIKTYEQKKKNNPREH